ncbi:MAG TPA: HAD-IA family hydrolase [Thermoanaerobaculia bacterium]
MIAAVTFDVTHTLIHSPRLGAIYAAVLARHGTQVGADEAGELVRAVWSEFACLADPGHDRFTSHPGGARGWWHRFLLRLAEHLGAPPPSRFAAAELYHRFGSAEAWEIYPDVPATLAALRAKGLRLGIVSNWDERLPQLLARLGLASSFEAIVCSSQVGVEKPDRRIFRRALELLAVEPEAALHVGDHRLEDVEGAIAAGMRGVHLDRRGKSAGLAGLAELPHLIDAPTAPAPATGEAAGPR